MAPEGKNHLGKTQVKGLPLISGMKERRKGWEEFIQKLQTDVERSSNAQCGTLPEYFEHIETQTSKLLKKSDTILFKRNESRLLKDGKFLEWSDKFFKVCLELSQYMTLEEVKAHNRKIFVRNLVQIEKKITKAKSDLQKKLILRKEKGNGFDEQSLTMEIRREWKRLLKVMSLEDLVIYSLDVLKNHKLKQIQKKQTEVFTKEEINKKNSKRGVRQLRVRRSNPRISP